MANAATMSLTASVLPCGMANPDPTPVDIIFSRSKMAVRIRSLSTTLSDAAARSIMALMISSLVDPASLTWTVRSFRMSVIFMHYSRVHHGNEVTRSSTKIDTNAHEDRKIFPSRITEYASRFTRSPRDEYHGYSASIHLFTFASNSVHNC